MLWLQRCSALKIQRLIISSLFLKPLRDFFANGFSFTPDGVSSNLSKLQNTSNYKNPIHKNNDLPLVNFLLQSISLEWVLLQLIRTS